MRQQYVKGEPEIKLGLAAVRCRRSKIKKKFQINLPAWTLLPKIRLPKIILPKIVLPKIWKLPRRVLLRERVLRERVLPEVRMPRIRVDFEVLEPWRLFLLKWDGSVNDAQITLGVGLGMPAGPILGGMLGVWLGPSDVPILQAVLGVMLGILLIIPGLLVVGALGALLGKLLYPLLRMPVLGPVLILAPALGLIATLIPWSSLLEKGKTRLAGLAGTVAGAVLGMWLGEAPGAILGVWVGIWVGIMVLLLLEKLHSIKQSKVKERLSS